MFNALESLIFTLLSHNVIILCVCIIFVSLPSMTHALISHLVTVVDVHPLISFRYRHPPSVSRYGRPLSHLVCPLFLLPSSTLSCRYRHPDPPSHLVTTVHPLISSALLSCYRHSVSRLVSRVVTVIHPLIHSPVSLPSPTLSSGYGRLLSHLPVQILELHSDGNSYFKIITLSPRLLAQILELHSETTVILRLS